MDQGRDHWIERLRRASPPLVVVAAMAMAAIMFAGVFKGEPKGDDLTFHLAEITRLADCLRAGDFDWWNPSANAGFASAYYYQVLPQLVPAAATALFGTSALPWFQLCIFLPLVVAPAAAYRALRVMHAPGWAAAAGALALLTCAGGSRWGHGADGTFSVGLYTQTWALAALPLAFAHGMRWIDGDRHLVAATGWGLFVGLCHPFAGVAVGVGLVSALVIPAVWRGLRSLGESVDAVTRARPLSSVVGAAFLRAAAWWRASDAVCDDVTVAGGCSDGRRRTFVTCAGRLGLLGVLLIVGAAPAWLPVWVDYDGFGGFPHRVADEVGPGLRGLVDWVVDGTLLDSGRDQGRLLVLTSLLPVALIAGRGWALRWLWPAAAGYAALLASGRLLVTGDDLLPAVRFLGPLQIALAMGIGVGCAQLLARVWASSVRARLPLLPQAAVASTVGVLVVLLLVPTLLLQRHRVRVASELPDVHRDEITTIIAALAAEPEGRKQSRSGADNHWFNLLPYVLARRPALMQMGGAALQASPNYVFLFQERDPLRTAWLYDAPYLVSGRSQDKFMPTAEEVIRTRSFIVRRLPSPGLVTPVQIDGELPPGRVAARRAALTWLRGSLLVSNRLRAYAGDQGLKVRPQATVRDAARHSPGDGPDITATVEAIAPTTIVFRESWHPRWEVRANGTPLPVRHVTPAFFAVDVPAGTSHLEAEFRRPLWAWLVYLAIGVSLLAAAVVQRSPRRANL